MKRLINKQGPMFLSHAVSRSFFSPLSLLSCSWSILGIQIFIFWFFTKSPRTHSKEKKKHYLISSCHVSCHDPNHPQAKACFTWTCVRGSVVVWHLNSQPSNHWEKTLITELSWPRSLCQLLSVKVGGLAPYWAQY